MFESNVMSRTFIIAIPTLVLFGSKVRYIFKYNWYKS